MKKLLLASLLVLPVCGDVLVAADKEPARAKNGEYPKGLGKQSQDHEDADRRHIEYVLKMMEPGALDTALEADKAAKAASVWQHAKEHAELMLHAAKAIDFYSSRPDLEDGFISEEFAGLARDDKETPRVPADWSTWEMLKNECVAAWNVLKMKKDHYFPRR